MGASCAWPAGAATAACCLRRRRVRPRLQVCSRRGDALDPLALGGAALVVRPGASHPPTVPLPRCQLAPGRQPHCTSADQTQAGRARAATACKDDDELALWWRPAAGARCRLGLASIGSRLWFWRFAFVLPARSSTKLSQPSLSNSQQS